MLKKMEVGKNTKEYFAEMSKNKKIQDGLGSKMMQLDSPELQKSIEKFRHGKCKATFHKVTEYNGFKGTLLLRLPAIGSRPEFGGDPNSPVLAPLIRTFYFCASSLKDWQLLRLQPWTCLSWEPSQCHEFRLGGCERGYGWHRKWATMNLNLTATRS